MKVTLEWYLTELSMIISQQGTDIPGQASQNSAVCTSNGDIKNEDLKDSHFNLSSK